MLKEYLQNCGHSGQLYAQNGPKAQIWLNWWFLWAKIDSLCPNGLQIGLIGTLDTNDGHLKLYKCIFKNGPRMGKKSPKLVIWLGVALISDGHSSANFHPILTNKDTKMIYSLSRIDWWKELSSNSFGLDFRILGLKLIPAGTKTGVKQVKI